MLRLSLLLLLASALGPRASAQVVFDEGDGEPGYYRASDGEATGGDALDLAGEFSRKLPLDTRLAYRGAVSGRLTYTHNAGTFRLDVGAPGFAALDFTRTDSVVVWLNALVGVPGVRLPSLSLVDAAGVETARLPLDFRTLVGLDANRSGFQGGSPTDAALRVRYVSTLPAAQPRPGYPEALTVEFSNDVVSRSTAAIGFPARDARFRVLGAQGQPLPFRFVDSDLDGTLSATADYIEVLFPDIEGGTILRPTWRLDLTAVPARKPAAGDVYRLAVFNGGVDGDPATWQRRAVSVSDFGPLGTFDRARVRAVRFTPAQGTFASAAAEYSLFFDALRGVEGTAMGPAPPTNITTAAGNQTTLLRWTPTPGAAGVLVYRRAPGELAFTRLTPDRVTQDHFADLSAANGVAYTYVLRSLGFGGINTPGVQGADSAPAAATPTASVYDPYLELTERLAFDFFWLEANPANGLVKDRSTPGSASSIASVGFGLSAITVGVDRGYVTRAQAVGRTLATLRFFATCPQSDAPSGICGYRGFFYHFLNMDTGLRAGTNELSTIDTALLLGGVLHAATYYDGPGADEAEIRTLADQIWRRVEWDWAAPRAPLVTLGWKPEVGFNICNGGPCDWNGYNEAMLLYVLGLGSPTHPLRSDAWSAWTAGYAGQWQTHYGISFLTFPPLFGHQYSHVWIDFRGIQDAYMRGQGIDYFENSRRATLASRAYSIANPAGHPNYSADEWGLTASDDPFGYRAHGAPPAQSDNGTITPTAAGGSIAFTPDISREALRTFYARYRPRLWGPYGLKDAYNVRENWVATDYLGIDQGPIVLMIENERTGAIWSRFMTHPDVRRGLSRAGFMPTPVSAEDGAGAPRLELLAPSPNPSRGRVALAYTLPEAGPVRLDVFDALGRLVARLADAEQAAGAHSLLWDASARAAGVYVVRLEASGEMLTRRIVVAR